MEEEVDLGENPDLEETVVDVNELKSFVVNYVGEKMAPEDGNVTVGMVVEVFAQDFPEFLMAVAEENWIRGYHQGLEDVETGEKLLREETRGAENETNEKTENKNSE